MDVRAMEILSLGMLIDCTTTTPQQHKQFSLTLLAEGTGCGTYDQLCKGCEEATQRMGRLDE